MVGGGVANKSAVGFKTKLADSAGGGALPWFVDEAEAGRLLLVCLRRRNWVKHAVSNVRHLQEWELCGHRMMTRVKACPGRVEAQPVSVDAFAKALPHALGAAAEAERVCKGAAQRAPPGRVMEVMYEDLAYGEFAKAWASGEGTARAAREAALSQIHRFLGVEPRPETLYMASLLKITRPDLALSVSNFAELEAYVAREFGEGSVEMSMLRDPF